MRRTLAFALFALAWCTLGAAEKDLAAVLASGGVCGALVGGFTLRAVRDARTVGFALALICSFEDREVGPCTRQNVCLDAFPAASLLELVSLQELKELHFNGKVLKFVKNAALPADLRAANFSARELFDAGFETAALRAGGYTLREIFQGFPGAASSFFCKEVVEANFSFTDVKAEGLSPEMLSAIGSNCPQLLSGAVLLDMFTLAEVRAALSTLGAASNALSMIKELAGPAALREAGFSALELFDAGFAPAAICAGGYTPTRIYRDLLGSPTSGTCLLLSANFSLQEIRNENLGKELLSDVTAADFACPQLVSGAALLDTFSLAEVKGAVPTLDGAIRALRIVKEAAGPAALRAAGFSARELFDAGISPASIRDGGFTPAQIVRDFTFSRTYKVLTRLGPFGTSEKTESRTVSVGMCIILAANFSLKDVKAAGLASELLNANEEDLACTQLINGTALLDAFSLTEVRGAAPRVLHAIKNSAAPAALRAAGLSAREGCDAGQPPAALRAGGYPLVELKLAGLGVKELLQGYSLPELAASFSAREMSAAGVSERDLEAAGFSQLAIRCAARTLFGVLCSAATFFY